LQVENRVGLFDKEHFARSTDNNGGLFMGQPRAFFVNASIAFYDLINPSGISAAGWKSALTLPRLNGAGFFYRRPDRLERCTSKPRFISAR